MNVVMTAGNMRGVGRSTRSLSAAPALLWVTALVLLAGCVESTEQAAHGRVSTTPDGTAGTAGTADSLGRASNNTNITTGQNAANVVESNRDRCVVASVTDGDSMRCVAQGRIRLLLLDAPEMSQAPFGGQSRDALRRLINRGDTVWLEYDVRREDQYGRTLAHVWTSPSGGTHVNLAQAANGWAVAVVFQPNVRYIEAIRRAVATARAQKRGLWADGNYSCEPIDHKRGNC